MSVQIKLRREAASFLSTFAGAAGELLVDTTNNRVQVHDGVTAGGFPAAKLSEVSPLSALMIASQGAAHGSAIAVGCLEDTIACSGASNVSTRQIPNRAIVFGVSVYVVTAITVATSFNADATTSSNGGAGTTAGQFGARPRRFRRVKQRGSHRADRLVCGLDDHTDRQWIQLHGRRRPHSDPLSDLHAADILPRHPLSAPIQIRRTADLYYLRPGEQN